MADGRWDVVVVGGGAAGFYGAITCAEAASRPLRVLILERSRRVLQKVKISGGGRCNVTHDSDDRRWLATMYPRGSKPLIGPLHKYGPLEVVRWFAARGVELKTEADGRMFPVTDDSQTVIDCLRQAAVAAGVELRTRVDVEAIVTHGQHAGGFELICGDRSRVFAQQVLLATGGTRAGAGGAIAAMLGHDLLPPVPSLFTFEIDDPRIEGLQGVAVEDVEVQVVGAQLVARGALVVTHWGMSGPAVLKVSAWGARELHARDYAFTAQVNWLPGVDVATRLKQFTRDSVWGKRQIATRAPFDALPKRLWQRLVDAAGVPSERTWAECSRELRDSLTRQLTAGEFAVSGKSLNKDEFVTCGGVSLDDVNLRTMESQRCPGLYFAGEVLDIDGVTGGFNFQSAWTTGHLAGVAMAEAAAAR